jgi:signal transduction histidine kinase
MSGASLRGRLFIGAVFWSVGLLILASVALSTAVDHHPGAAIGVHAALAYGFIAPAIAVLCMVAGFLQVRRGLSAVGALRDRLTGLRGGRHYRLDGTYPSEVQPLVDDLNDLLDERDQAVQRAVTKAADLAHGLKTPLAVLAHEADRAARAGQCDIAASIQHQVDRMRKQVDYQLAHARASVPGRSSSGRVAIAGSIEGLVRALERLHAERGLVFDRRLDPAAVARGQPFDIDEMLGNLLDNACRWARSRVVVTTAAEGPSVLVTIEDDGPGLDRDMREAVLRRGVRADESGPGSGLGLAIVRDLADLYGGSVTLGDAAAGGLRAELRLPACRS